MILKHLITFHKRFQQDDYTVGWKWLKVIESDPKAIQQLYIEQDVQQYFSLLKKRKK